MTLQRSEPDRALNTDALGFSSSGPSGSLDRDSLLALLDNRIPAIHVPGYVSPAQCEQFCRAVRSAPLRHYSVQPPVAYVGMAQYEYRWNRPKADYFSDVAAAEQSCQAIFDAGFDPVSQVIESLEAAWAGPVGRAQEPGLGHYFAGIIRLAGGGIKLHADYAPINAPGWSVADLDAQIGWNIYFEVPDVGGDTIVYGEPWQADLVDGQAPPSYGLDHAALAEAPSYRFHPRQGELVFFNVRNPHEVLGADGAGSSRVSIGAFVGRMPDGRLVLWS
ncbi:MAG: hypothetical protein RL322_1529 [Pseudomonadota bacterium]|jgi:hypothetical protein